VGVCVGIASRKKVRREKGVILSLYYAHSGRAIFGCPVLTHNALRYLHNEYGVGGGCVGGGHTKYVSPRVLTFCGRFTLCYLLYVSL